MGTSKTRRWFTRGHDRILTWAFPLGLSTSSRAAAVFGTTWWIVSTLALLVVSFLLVAGLVGFDVRSGGWGYSTIWAAAAIGVVVALPQVPRRDREVGRGAALVPVTSRVSGWVVGGFTLLFMLLGLWIAGSASAPGRIVVAGASAGAAGLFVGCLWVGQLVLGALVWRHVRNWNRDPFFGWVGKDFSRAKDENVFGKRLPLPTRVSASEARVRAAWCREQVQSAGLLAQLVALVGAGLFGAGIPLLLGAGVDATAIEHTRTVGRWLAAGGVLVGTFGYRVAYMSVPRLEMRTRGYAEVADRGLPALRRAGHGRVIRVAGQRPGRR